MNGFKLMRLGRVAVILIALILLLSACSPAATTTTQTTTTQSASQNTIGENVLFDLDKKLSGKLSVWFYEDGKRFIDTLFQDYTQYRPDVDLNIQYIAWGDYWKKLPVAISSGTGPDLFYFHNAFHNLMVDGGLIEAYPQDLVDNLAKDYVNVEQFAVNGKTYYIGVGGGHGIIFYNKAMWREAGLSETEFPATWDDLRENAIKLTKKDGDKITVAGFNYNPSGGAFINDWQYLAGKFLFSPDGKQILIDNPEFKNVFKFFVDLYLVDGVCSPTYPDAMQSFMDGTTAMLWMHPFFNGVLKSQRPDLEFGVFAQPKFGDAARNWHYNNPDVSMGINPKATADAKVLALDLLHLYFADEKYMRDWDLAQGLAPTRKSLANDATLSNDPVLKVIMQDFDNSVYAGPAPDQMTQDLIQNMVDPVLKNGADIDAAVKAGVAKVNQTLADFEFYPAERMWSHADELK